MAGGLLIRADADERIGTGHVMRCLALAQAWLDAKNGPVWLAANALPDEVRRRYEREGAFVLSVAAGALVLPDVIRDKGATWAVLDGYGFGLAFQRAAKEAGASVLVVDDDGVAGEYIADVVVDSNVFAAEPPYAKRDANTCLLLGPRFALLRRELRGHRAPRGEPASRVLVTFGGADPAGLSPLALDALGPLPVQITLIIGPANPRRVELEQAARALPNARVLWDASDMRALMDCSDVALAAAGGTCLELAHAGVPQIVAVTASNQERVAEALVEGGVAISVGEACQVTAEGMRRAVVSLLADQRTRAEMSARAVRLVDGYGAERVVAHMMSQTA